MTHFWHTGSQYKTLSVFQNRKVNSEIVSHDCQNWDFRFASKGQASTPLGSPPIIPPCFARHSPVPFHLPPGTRSPSSDVNYEKRAHGRLNSSQTTFICNGLTHHGVVQAERAPKPMAVSPGVHLRGQGEGKRVPV